MWTVVCVMDINVILRFQGYGCPGLSITASAVATAEVARVDASCSTFILVHSSLAMLTIGKILLSFQVHLIASSINALKYDLEAYC